MSVCVWLIPSVCVSLCKHCSAESWKKVTFSPLFDWLQGVLCVQTLACFHHPRCVFVCVCVCVCVCIWVCIIKSECTVSRSECVNMWACLCQYSLFFLHTASVCSYFISVCVCVCVCISVCVGAYLHAFHPAGAERQLRAAPPDNTAQNGNTEPVMMTGLYSRRRNAAAWR